MSAEVNNTDNSFDVNIPWIIEEETELTLDLHDRRLLGSGRHFVRFDLYPAYAPSHLKRHFGFWDLPLKHISRQRVKLVFKQGGVWMKKGWRTVYLKPVWKGNLEFIGYSMLHVSLWDFSEDPPVQLTIKSSQHVIRYGKPDLPLEHVSLPITQRCNLKCPMCMRNVPENWSATDVSPEVLSPVLDASPFVHSVSIFGIGEPLLYENIFGVIEELKRRMPEDSQVGFNTNGTLMTRKAASRMIDLGVNWLTFSVDGATKSTYERIRIGADFDKTIENIAHMVECRNASSQDNLWLQANYVIQTENVHEIPAFAKMAGSLGLDSVIFSHLKDYQSGEFRVFGEEALGPLFEEAAAIGRENGVRMIFPRVRPLDESRCMFMQAAYLWLSGEVVPCCRMLKGACPGPIRTFGNVRKNSLMEIWNSTEYREFRQRVLARDFPDECKGCSYATGLLLLKQ